MKKLNKPCCLLLAFLMLSLVFTALAPTAAQAAGAKLRMYNIWATWCGPCVHELPDLGEISRKYKGVVEVIGMQLDATFDDGTPNEEGVQEAKRLFAANNCTYENRAFDEDTYWMLDGVDAVPTTIFLDAKGKEVQRIIGTRDFQGWAAVIEGILAGLPDDPAATLPGDADGDGDVTLKDLQAVVDYLVSEKMPKSLANANADGKGDIDEADLAAIIEILLAK